MKLITRRMKTFLFLLTGSLLASACAPEGSVDGLYSHMTSSDFSLGGGYTRSIISSNNF